MQNKEKKSFANLLVNAGLTDKEAKLYLALLAIGRGTVSEVARNSGIGRTHCYVILDDLISKKLISISGKEPKQEYVVESPAKLSEFVEARLSKQKEVSVEIAKRIPELLSEYKVGDRPRVRFYEGLEGLIDVYDDTLTAKTPIVAYASYEDMHPLLPNYFKTYYKRRVQKGISARGIVPATPMANERRSKDTEEMRELKLVPKDRFGFTPDIEIYDNKVMIASWREKLGIIIESGEIADAMKKIFELAWIGAKTLEKRK